MTASKKLYLDESIGETRGVVVCGDQAERLLIFRDHENDRANPGAILVARVTKIDPGLGLVFLETPEAQPLISQKAGFPKELGEGGTVKVQITSWKRRGKSPQARVLSPDPGPPRWIEEAPSLRRRLESFAPESRIITTKEAGEIADLAVEEALQTLHPLRNGSLLSIETTRALTAIDVDMAEVQGQDKLTNLTKVNQLAITEAARLIRLKGLGGLVVIDLVGKGHNGEVLLDTAKKAFAVDQPGVAFGPISRFGILEISLPWRMKPVADSLLDQDPLFEADPQNLSPMTQTLAMIRAILRQAGFGRRLEVFCHPQIAEIFSGFRKPVLDKVGPCFELSLETQKGSRFWEVIIR